MPPSAEPAEPPAEAAAEKAEEEKPAEETSEAEGSSKPEGGAETEKERKKWSQEAMMKLTRKFNLDLTPKVRFTTCIGYECCCCFFILFISWNKFEISWRL